MALNIGLAGHNPLEVCDNKQTYLQNDLSSFLIFPSIILLLFILIYFFKFELRSLGVFFNL